MVAGAAGVISSENTLAVSALVRAGLSNLKKQITLSLTMLRLFYYPII
jgi:hypothetical protein